MIDNKASQPLNVSPQRGLRLKKPKKRRAFGSQTGGEDESWFKAEGSCNSPLRGSGFSEERDALLVEEDLAIEKCWLRQGIGNTFSYCC